MKKQLIKERERLARIIKRTKQELENAPEGTLRIGKSQGHPQYYHCKNGTSHNGVYLPKKEIELARQLAQKSYNEKILRYADPRWRKPSNKNWNTGNHNPMCAKHLAKMHTKGNGGFLFSDSMKTAAVFSGFSCKIRSSHVE